MRHQKSRRNTNLACEPIQPRPKWPKYLQIWSLLRELPFTTRRIIRDILKEKITRQSHVKITGVQPLAQKIFDIKVGGRKYRVYIVALGWSYKSYLTAKGIKNWKPSAEINTNVIEQQEQKEYNSQTFEGPQGDIYDW